MRLFILLIISTFIFTSCKKYLDKVPDNSLTVPNTLDALQKLLVNDFLTTQTSPALGDISSDDYYLDYTNWQSMPVIVQSDYLWKDTTDNISGFYGDWSSPYQAIYYANAALDALDKIKKDASNMIEWNNVRGSALFYRSFNFYALEETYGQPYNPGTADADLGIPLRLSSDLNSKSVRSSVKETFTQIIQDLTEAKDLLPTLVPSNTPNKVSKASAMALLARVYLTMQDYQNAGLYADSSLSLNNTLVDYNTVDPTQFLPFLPPGPEEVLYSCSEVYYASVYADSSLYNLYDSNDLRKSVYFNASGGVIAFQGSYGTGVYLFNGLATDEMYLVSAECNARSGNISHALNGLNTLLNNRYKSGTFINHNETTSDSVLMDVLNERRKELAFRGLRWSDLRRLNQDSRFATSLIRKFNNAIYTLPPKDLRYTFLIPQEEINVSGIVQNKR